jgi:hypothetical protein
MKTVTLELPDHLIPLVESIGNQLGLVLEMGMSRLAPVSTRAYMEAVEFLTSDPTTDEIAGFRFSSDVESRISELLDKNSEGALSQGEEIELDRLSRLEEQLQLLKARAVAGAD